jgi:hypothetical protein
MIEKLTNQRALVAATTALALGAIGCNTKEAPAHAKLSPIELGITTELPEDFGKEPMRDGDYFTIYVDGTRIDTMAQDALRGSMLSRKVELLCNGPDLVRNIYTTYYETNPKNQSKQPETFYEPYRWQAHEYCGDNIITPEDFIKPEQPAQTLAPPA